MVMAFPKEFFTGIAKVPKQDFLNGGEIINSILQMIMWLMLVISGIVMWFPQYFGQGIVFIAYPTHNIALGLAIAVVVGYIYLSIGHPNSNASISGMINGKVSAVYAKEHHVRWYDEVTDQTQEESQNKGA